MNRISTFLKLRRNALENLRKQTRVQFESTEELCEHIGHGLCEQIDNGKLTIEQVIQDAITFALVNARDTESRYFSWLTLHMSLGICFQYRIDNKELIRQVLIALLPFSHGVDFGIYLRDMLQGFRQHNTGVSSVINIGQSELTVTDGPEKSIYFLKHAAGLTINLRDPQILKTLFDGTGRAVWAELLDRKSCLYIDLPVAHAHLQPMMIHQPLTASLQVSSLLLAIMNMKPDIVLLLLQYGASAEGPPLRYLLRTLGTIDLFHGINNSSPTHFSNPVTLVANILLYCLRTIPYVHIKTDKETLGNNRLQTYYVKRNVLQFVPSWVTGGVPLLKHICRCFIRHRLILCDKLPQEISNLELPVTLTDYLNLKC